MIQLPEKPIRLVIQSLPGHLPIVRAAVEKLCDVIGFDAVTAGAIMLSVDEAITNIIRHAYDNAGDQTIEVELTPLGGELSAGLRIRLRDYGQAVDPSRIKSRDLSDIRPGGLGVHIMNECMDHLDYCRADGGGTILTMVKHLAMSDKGSVK